MAKSSVFQQVGSLSRKLEIKVKERRVDCGKVGTSCPMGGVITVPSSRDLHGILWYE